MNMRVIIWIMCSSIVVCGQSTSDAPKRTLRSAFLATQRRSSRLPQHTFALSRRRPRARRTARSSSGCEPAVQQIDETGRLLAAASLPLQSAWAWVWA